MKQQRKHKLIKITGYQALIAVLGRAAIESKVTPLAPDKKLKTRTKGLVRKRRKNNNIIK